MTTWTFHDEPEANPGTYGYRDYVEENDGTDMYDAIHVYGDNSVDAGPDPDSSSNFRKIVYDRVTPADIGTATYPTKYQSAPGWAYVLQDQRIKTLEEALLLAERIYGVASQPRKTITFTVVEDVRETDTVIMVNRALRGPSDSGLILPVVGAVKGKREDLEVTFVTAGQRKQTIQDILSGPTVDLLNLRTAGVTRNKISGGLNFNDPLTDHGPNVARGNNEMLSLTDQDIAFFHRAPVNQSKLMRNGVPIDDANAYNFYLDPTSWDALLAASDGRPDPDTAVIPKPQTLYTDKDGNVKEWTDAATGVNHPQHHVFEFIRDGWQSVILPDMALLSSIVMLTEYTEAGVRVADFDGVTTDGTFSAVTLKLMRKRPSDGVMVDVDPPVSKAHPFLVGFGYPVTVWASGIPDGHVITVYVGERDPDPRLFLNQPAVGP